MFSFLKKSLIAALLCSPSGACLAQTNSDDSVDAANAVVDQLQAPLYNPFVERYVLDEIKQLRVDQAQTKIELTKQMVDREHASVDRAVAYATNTVTYFFYLIAAATSILVIVGWSSIREIKERVHSIADKEIARLVNEYEGRLQAIEEDVKKKSEHIQENKEEIELTQEVQSLWLRAQQENSPSHKIAIYDQILSLRHDDCEALTYKADAVLELDEPQWAANLCHQALQIDPDNGHAFYQLACAYTALDSLDDALYYVKRAIRKRDNCRDEIRKDPAFSKLKGYAPFENLLSTS